MRRTIGTSSLVSPELIRAPERGNELSTLQRPGGTDAFIAKYGDDEPAVPIELAR